MVTRTYNFTASGFGAGAPQATVTGDFTVTYDPSVDSDPFGSPVSGINLTIAGHTYTTADTIFAAGPDFSTAFSLGGAPGGFILAAGTNDFELDFDGTPDGPFTNIAFSYIIPSTTFGTPIEATTVTVSLATAVPKTASLGLFGVGLAGLGMVLRTRRV